MNVSLDSIDWPSADALIALSIAIVPRVLAALLVRLAFYMPLRVLQPALRNIFRRAGIAAALIHLLVDGVVRGAVWVVALVMAASQLGINVGARSNPWRDARASGYSGITATHRRRRGTRRFARKPGRTCSSSLTMSKNGSGNASTDRASDRSRDPSPSAPDRHSKFSPSVNIFACGLPQH